MRIDVSYRKGETLAPFLILKFKKYDIKENIMLEFSKRNYLQKIIYNKFLKDFDKDTAKWYTSVELQNYDQLLLMEEDQLHTANTVDRIESYQDVIELFDEPIRGTGEGIELDSVVVPKDYKYLGDVMGKIPLDVMLLKGKTGVGGTTLAIQDRRKWVVCAGSRNIVRSKSKKHKKALGVYAIGHGGATNEQIEEYKGNTIITTWASLGRVMSYINVKEWSLLIDENQELIRDGGFRGKDINNLLKVKDQFKHYTLMSATETRREDYRGSIDGLDILKINWEKKKEYIIEREETAQLENTLAERAKRVLEDEELPNVHIFINKLESIIRVALILEKALGKDLSDEISIVASDKSTNIDKIEKIGNGKYELEDEESIKRINFYTATSFSGVDINDDFGDIVIAVNGNINYTRLEFKEIKQITGRIRDKRKDIKTQLIYSKGDLSKKVSWEDFKSGYKDMLKDAKATEEWYNKLSHTGRENKNNKSKIIGAYGLQLIEGKAVIDNAYFMNKRNSYPKDNTLYTEIFTSDKDIIAHQGSETFRFIKGEGIHVSEEIADVFENIKVKSGTSFRALLQELLDDMDNDGWEKFWWTEDDGIDTRKYWVERILHRHEVLTERFPYIKDTIYYFSPDQIRELGLKKSDIKFATEGKQNINKLVMLRKYINLSKGVKYTISDIKEKLKTALAKIGINKGVDSTYIKKVYPGIQKKKIRVDKEVVIPEDEYRKIRKENYDRSKANKIHLSTLLDKNGDVVKMYKTVINGGRQEVYLLPF